MAKGLSLPIRVASWGGLATVQGDDNDDKIIMMALTSDDNENAFQQNIGLGEAMIFELSDSSLRGDLIGRLREIFRKFVLQKRFSLVEDSIRWVDSHDTGDLILEFDYFCMESDEVKTFSKNLKANS